MTDCEETGVVKSVKNDTAKVALSRTHECGGCKACIFAGKGDIEILTHNAVGAVVGDRVRVDARRTGGKSLAAIALGLGVPLLFMIVSIVVCHLSGLVEWVNLLVSLGSLALGFCVTVGIDRVLRHTTRLAASIIEVVGNDAENIGISDTTGGDGVIAVADAAPKTTGSDSKQAVKPEHGAECSEACRERKSDV